MNGAASIRDPLIQTGSSIDEGPWMHRQRPHDRAVVRTRREPALSTKASCFAAFEWRKRLVSCQPPNKQLHRTVMRRRARGACDPRTER